MRLAFSVRACIYCLLFIGLLGCVGCGDSAPEAKSVSQGDLDEFLRDNPEYAAPVESTSDGETLGLEN
ncbi:MAG: hypothetical protein ACR2NZ_07315 [Rubripirellula sp.]